MEHQVFSSYYQLCLSGKADPLLCINKDHLTYMIPYWDILEERSEFRCLVGHCDYKIIPGLTMYQDMMKQVYYADQQ